MADTRELLTLNPTKGLCQLCCFATPCRNISARTIGIVDAMNYYAKISERLPRILFFSLASSRRVYPKIDRPTPSQRTFFVRSFRSFSSFPFFFFIFPRGKSSTFEQYLAIVSGRLEVTRRLPSLSEVINMQPMQLMREGRLSITH